MPSPCPDTPGPGANVDPIPYLYLVPDETAAVPDVTPPGACWISWLRFSPAVLDRFAPKLAADDAEELELGPEE